MSCRAGSIVAPGLTGATVTDPIELGQFEDGEPVLIVLATWDAADGAQRTKLLSGLFERMEAQVMTPGPGTKFETKRQADAVAALLAQHGHEVEWVRKNYGAQGRMTWNVRLSNRDEIHNANGLEGYGLALPRSAWPAVGRVQVVAVPKSGLAPVLRICATGAGDGTRTRYLNLGKVALCQVSYSRVPDKSLAR
jgi:hypothetical protein